jgi:hypothetical protein
VAPDALVLGDAWERSYGDLQWRHLQPERLLPRYWIAHDPAKVFADKLSGRDVDRPELIACQAYLRIDTTTVGGRLVFHIFAALAEFIRELIVEATHEGLAPSTKGIGAVFVSLERVRACRNAADVVPQNDPPHAAESRELRRERGRELALSERPRPTAAQAPAQHLPRSHRGTASPQHRSMVTE